MTKTFFLVGENVGPELEFAISQRTDAKEIEHKDSPTIFAAIKQLPTQDNLNIILTAHGGKENLYWDYNGAHPTSYKSMFTALPQDGRVQSIVLQDCYGGSALEGDTVKAAPPGAVVISLAGAAEEEKGMFTTATINHTKGMTNPAEV